MSAISRRWSVLVLLVVSACTGRAQEEGYWTITNGVMPFVLFPQLPEPPARFTNGAAISADPDAPPCITADPTILTARVRVRLPRADLPVLDLGLPLGYEWHRSEHDDGFRQKGELWGGLLGDVRKDSVGVELYGLEPGGMDDITFWLDQGEGYPTAGLQPGTVQTSVSECQLPLPSTTLRLVRYATRSPAGEEWETAAAYWVVKDDIVLSATGTGNSAEEFERILALMQGVRLGR